MRIARTLAAAALLALPAAAQVHLTIKSDGKKVISNFGAAGSRRGSDYNWLARQHNRPSKWDKTIDFYADKYGVDPVLVRAVIQVESDFNPGCVSNKGARGLMQLMPATAREYGIAKVHDPEENIRGGVRHLAYMLNLFPDLPRALAAYNAGENAVYKYGGIPPYEETTNYVKRALTVYYGQPYGGATSFAGGRTPKLRGGFGRDVVAPLAAMMPGMKYLGSQ
ncbi:MAG TPA: lytic transglycosylase domain-containing protein [Thermoanaerobaculia bacterium]|nr:lytic transglycosylase domain-containing protein [Thermoanaerobaculia bacterium]